ncbi:hypothetical protein GCM10010406_41240 [Streptomyces thermolineatus]|uniref:RNA polymerase sigma factor 70 region 4 type 2 domain-containing protein n=1 Tax=Streptomyces thermolineatus TaxID=44033 RepID=A0ABN3MEM8_9ACTN|nr:sigma-70 family RNA polymerase sigma factor [Streptomyces sp. DJ]
MTDQTPDPGPAENSPELQGLLRSLPTVFAAFHDTYARPYLGYAHLNLGNRDDAVRVVEQVFTELGRTWDDVMLQGNYRAHGWATLKEHVVAMLALHGRQQAMVETATFDSVLRAGRRRMADLESGLGLYAAIARLPERQSDIVILRHVLGWETKAIADLMGIELASVRSHLRMARNRLARDLNLRLDHDDEGALGDR